ncbi:RHOMBOID-like protein 9, chloroplastic isoform X1 [Ziziphus jujuba]|uniref:RHOMBOID-like protein 9, chloroplastic isoform X1 n=4 Tax=Ziziphus jujuba TaxID=326968 RepID=A0A6P3ZNI0_ZIZJJ|nr:RHOMBOID-like protein 9, chloroplastic isoform X1 [Ziziphus jujuba]
MCPHSSLLKALTDTPFQISNYMAVVPICYKIPCRGQTQPIQNVMRESDRGFTCDYIAIVDGPRCFSSVSSDICRKWHSLCPNIDVLIKTKTRGNAPRGPLHYGGSSLFKNMNEVTALQTRCKAQHHLRSKISGDDSHNRMWYALDSSTSEKQLRSLGSYFGKLQDGTNSVSSNSSNKTEELLSRSSQSRLKKELETLEAYLDKLNKVSDANSKKHVSSSLAEHTMKASPAAKPLSESEDSERGDEQKMNSYMSQRSRTRNVYQSSSSFQGQQQYDETSDLYLICVLGSINIAVFLFEIASPVRTSELELFSLPLLYGAKINHLITVGEWWRLVTPMFLHSGIFHIGVGCWALLTFGPKVSKIYGSFTCVLIYVLGGISGNLISFLHTPEPTVGGTGPIYAIIGAWLVYQIQNKDVIAKDVSDSMLQKAVITTALGCMLSNFGLVDNWTHFGAAFTGMAYAYFTCPTIQLGDASSRTGQEEGISLVKRSVDPCKSLFFFSIFILVLSSLVFFVEPPLNDLAYINFCIGLYLKV